MPRGKSVPVGSRTRNANGYWMVKTEQGWRFVHHIAAEDKLRRPLLKGERVTFKDGNKDNCIPNNMEIVQKDPYVLLQYELIALDKQLDRLQERKRVVEQELRELKDSGA